MQERYCQNPTCHTRDTVSRIRGVKGAKVLRTKKITYLNHYNKCFNYFCDQTCLMNWLQENIDRCIGTIGLITKPSETPINIIEEVRQDYYGKDFIVKTIIPLSNLEEYNNARE